jgi:hypothetical protein
MKCPLTCPVFKIGKAEGCQLCLRLRGVRIIMLAVLLIETVLTIIEISCGVHDDLVTVVTAYSRLLLLWISIGSVVTALASAINWLKNDQDCQNNEDGEPQ